MNSPKECKIKSRPQNREWNTKKCQSMDECCILWIKLAIELMLDIKKVTLQFVRLYNWYPPT